MAEYVRSCELLDRQRSCVVLVDLQERLMAAMADAGEVTAAARFLAEAAALFGVPVSVTEQYPRGLGATVAALTPFADIRPSKLRFSGVEALEIEGVSDAPETRDQVVLAGVETHVCVLQTAFDLLSLGYRVYVAADAVTSRFPLDRECALARLRDSGAIVTTVEAIAFEWCETADDPQFKALSSLVKSRDRSGGAAS